MAGRSGAKRGAISSKAAEAGMDEFDFVRDIIERYGSKQAAAAAIGVTGTTLDYWLRTNNATVFYQPTLKLKSEVNWVFNSPNGDK